MVKTIRVSDEVYRKLLLAKRKDERLSELLNRLVQKASARELPEKIRGSVDFSDEEKEDILSEIRSKRAERRY